MSENVFTRKVAIYKILQQLDEELKSFLEEGQTLFDWRKTDLVDILFFINTLFGGKNTDYKPSVLHLINTQNIKIKENKNIDDLVEIVKKRIEEIKKI